MLACPPVPPCAFFPLKLNKADRVKGLFASTRIGSLKNTLRLVSKTYMKYININKAYLCISVPG